MWAERRATISLTIEWRPLNLTLIAVCSMLIAVFFGYAFVENYVIVAR